MLKRAPLFSLGLEQLEARNLLTGPPSQIGELEIKVTYDLQAQAANVEDPRAESAFGPYRVPLLTNAIEYRQIPRGPDTQIKRLRPVDRQEDPEDRRRFVEYSAWNELWVSQDVPQLGSTLWLSKSQQRPGNHTAEARAKATVSVELTPIVADTALVGSSVELRALMWLRTADAHVCTSFPPWNECDRVNELSAVSIRGKAGFQGSSASPPLDVRAEASANPREIRVQSISVPTTFGSTATLTLEHELFGVMVPHREDRISELLLDVITANVPTVDVSLQNAAINTTDSDLFKFEHVASEAGLGEYEVAIVHSADKLFDPTAPDNFVVTSPEATFPSDANIDIVYATKTVLPTTSVQQETITPVSQIDGHTERKELFLYIYPRQSSALDSRLDNNRGHLCSMPDGTDNQGWNPSFSPSDNDTIPDCAELLGYTWTLGNQPSRYVNLPRMGADPRVNDIFVEIDYMRGHRPGLEEMWEVQEAFLSAPVSYPHGASGINLHLDFGPDSIMDPRRNRQWNELSMAGEFPFKEKFFLFGSALNYDNFFRSDMQVQKDRGFSAARSPTFRYSAFVNQIGRNPSCDNLSLVTAGRTDSNDGHFAISDGIMSKYRWHKWNSAAVFMHELGHSLDLGHGGHSDTTNWKPNYLSVMNYSYLAGGGFDNISGIPIPALDPDGNPAVRYLLDYSSRVLPNLSEGKLDEGAGLGSNSVGQQIRWFSDGQPKQAWVNSPNNIALDWNGNGSIDSQPVAENVNNNQSFCGLINIDDEELESVANDWEQLDYQLHNSEDRHYDPQHATLLSAPLTGPADFDVAVVADDTLGHPGQSTSLSVRVTNTGTQADTYTVNVSSQLGWAAADNPNPLPLAPGQSRELSLAINVPAGAQPFEREAVAISVASSRALPLSETVYAYVPLDIDAPQIESIELRSSSWDDRFLSALQAAEHGISPWAGLDQLVVTFSEAVEVFSNDLAVYGVFTPSYATADFAYDRTSYTATWTLDRTVTADRLLVELADTIWDVAHNQLDGEWLGQFPTGQGSPLGKLEYPQAILVGDVSGDGVVDEADRRQIRERMGSTFDSPRYSARHDLNGNGTIDDTDLGLVVPGPSLPQRPASTAPRVTELLLGASDWDASASAAIQATLDSQEPPEVLPWFGINQITASFNKDILLATESLSVTGIGEVYPLQMDFTPEEATAIWRTDSPILAQRLRLELGEFVTDFMGTALDGEGFPNLPSSDGVPGGRVVIDAVILAGDVTGDHVVTNDDVEMVQSAIGAHLGDSNYQVLLDVNGSGAIDETDAALVSGRKNSPWQNPLVPPDVNNDGFIAPGDVLQTINFLNRTGGGQLSIIGNLSTPPFVDVNGDGVAASGDILRIINHLNANLARATLPAALNAEGESMGYHIVLPDVHSAEFIGIGFGSSKEIAQPELLLPDHDDRPAPAAISPAVIDVVMQGIQRLLVDDELFSLLEVPINSGRPL